MSVQGSDSPEDLGRENGSWHRGGIERSSKQQLEEVRDKKTKQKKEKLQDNHLTQRGFGFQSGHHSLILIV